MNDCTIERCTADQLFGNGIYTERATNSSISIIDTKIDGNRDKRNSGCAYISKGTTFKISGTSTFINGSVYLATNTRVEVPSRLTPAAGTIMTINSQSDQDGTAVVTGAALKQADLQYFTLYGGGGLKWDSSNNQIVIDNP